MTSKITIGNQTYPVPRSFDLAALTAAIDAIRNGAEPTQQQFTLVLPPSPRPRSRDRRLVFGPRDVEAIAAYGLDEAVAA